MLFLIGLFWLTYFLLKIDESPVDGKIFDRQALEELSKEGVTLVSLFIILTSIIVFAVL